MFGEKSIYGTSKVTTDEKARMVLPSYSFAEKEDELAVIEEYDNIKLQKLSELEKEVDKLNSLYRGETNPVKKKQLYNKLLDIYGSIKKTVKVDCNKRISLGKIVEPNKTYKLIGAKDSLIIK